MIQEKINRATGRVRILLKEDILFRKPEQIVINAPVALMQVAYLNELNGILLGLGHAKLRVESLPITKIDKSTILKVMKVIQ